MPHPSKKNPSVATVGMFSDRLHEGGYIDDPRTMAKSALFSDEGVKRSKVLFEKHFAK